MIKISIDEAVDTILSLESLFSARNNLSPKQEAAVLVAQDCLRAYIEEHE